MVTGYSTILAFARDAEVMKVYGGDRSVAPTSDDVEQATSAFREEIEILKALFTDYDLAPFLNTKCDPVERYKLLSKAAEYVFTSAQVLQKETEKLIRSHLRHIS